jgi:hypothetical protein
MPEPFIPTAIAKAAAAVTGDKTAKKKEARAKFEHAWTRIRDDLVAHLVSEGMPQDATEWYQRVRMGGCLSRDDGSDEHTRISTITHPAAS